MKIALYDSDGHSGFPNFALAKVSAAHKRRGDSVVINPPPLSPVFDVAYISKVFTFSKGLDFVPMAEHVPHGGTGDSNP